jgi:hypothetical protein
MILIKILIIDDCCRKNLQISLFVIIDEITISYLYIWFAVSESCRVILHIIYLNSIRGETFN